ncbi:MAG: DUF4404 family protein [Steroidobacteraceae bacterium]
MSRERIRELLGQLHEEVGSTELDPSTRSLMRELEHSLAAPATPPAAEGATLGDRVRALEARFAARHEGAENILRQMVDLLGKIGV